MKKILTLLLLVYSSVSFSQSLVISQVYGAGGNSGSIYTNDYIELFNPTANPINVDNWSVQYNSATSTTSTWQKTKLPNVTIQPGQYFLIQQAQGTGGNTPLPTADVVGVIAMSGTAGKVVLVSDTNAIAIACPTTNVVDKVGFGTTSTCFEGSGPTPAFGSNTNAVFRANNGCTDSNNNSADFTAAAAAPRNSSSPLNNCGGAPSPALIAAPATIAAFGNVNVGSSSTSSTFSLSGTNLTGAPGTITITAPANFEVSNDNTTWGSSTTVAFSAATLASTTVYVRFTPLSGGNQSGNVSITGGGVSTAVTVAVSGVGVSLLPSLGATTLASFGNLCVNATSNANSFTLTGTNLTAADISVGPLAGFTFATASAGTYTASLTLTQTGGTYSQEVFVKLTPAALQSYNGNIPVSGGGAATAISVAATGAGVSNPPTVATGASSAVTAFAATLAGSISDNGCTAVTAYGVEYSLTNNFTNGSGTQVASTNLATGNFTSVIGGLSPSTTYYYKVYATNGGGTTYGAQRAFTTLACIAPTVQTDTVNITTGYYDAVVGGSVVDTGCSNVTAYGIEYSSIGGFANGKGIKVFSNSSSSAGFTAGITGLIPNTTYYFKAFAQNSGGIAYGSQDTLKTQQLLSGLIVYSVPLVRGGTLHYSLDNVARGHYTIRLINTAGQSLYKKELFIQVGFIDDTFRLPRDLATGIYTLAVIPDGKEWIVKKILIQ